MSELLGRALERGHALVGEWEARLDWYAAEHPSLASELRRRLQGAPAPGLEVALRSYPAGEELATRQASQQVIADLSAAVPELFGGSADLSESNLTEIKGGGDFTATLPGRNLRFGVREHAMGAVANGIAYHGGFIPYAATFLTFSDYMRGSVRLAALSGLGVIYIWTHDSVGLGEDGPTHQPIEHFAALRAMPDLWLIRPGDANETVAAWALALQRRDGPVALALSRQKLPTLPGTAALARTGVARGGYVLVPASTEASGGLPELILIATGSEVHLAVRAAASLEEEGIPTRVVSMPCWERFADADQDHRDAVLPPRVLARVSIEAGVSLGWDRWVGEAGAILALDRFGASAPGTVVLEQLGFSAERLADLGRRVVRDGFHGRASALAKQ